MAKPSPKKKNPKAFIKESKNSSTPPPPCYKQKERRKDARVR
jgi:hypothetical protein